MADERVKKDGLIWIVNLKNVKEKTNRIVDLRLHPPLDNPDRIAQALKEGERLVYMLAEAWCNEGAIGSRLVRVEPPGNNRPYCLPHDAPENSKPVFIS